MLKDAIYRNGLVAVRYKEPVPKFVKVNGHEYVFTVQRSVSLCFMPEEDAIATLAIVQQKTCCGGGRSNGFFLANQASLNCFDFGGR